MRRPFKAALSFVGALIAVGSFALPAASADPVSTVVYTATVTIPVPPASTYAGNAGGDGWAIALTPAAVYNVFHHQTTMQVACHFQADASACWTPRTITDADSNGFATSGHPGLYLDQATGRLYVFGTRTSDDTAGVVCIDTVAAATIPNPFCGFTALSAVGEAEPGISAVTAPAVVAGKMYGFNFVSGAAVAGTENALLCFDLTTFAACPAQPYALGLPAGVVSSSSYPPPSIAAIGTRVIVPVPVGGADLLACYDGATGAVCSGSWPVASPAGYAPSGYGAPFPLLSAAGAIVGLCMPDGTAECLALDGSVAATPAGLGAAVPATSGWNGAAFTLGARVYVPNGNTDSVSCYDYSAGATCANFPKALANVSLLYTVNPDPQRPSCIWVNADTGGGQIQNFDAYTGAACGAGALRVIGATFVVSTEVCRPASWVSLQVLQPAPGTYSSGSVGFADGNANPIAGLPSQALDGTGSASLVGLALGQSGLPQFLITLNDPTVTSASVEVELTWQATNDPSCLANGASTGGAPVVTPTPTPTVVLTTTPAPIGLAVNAEQLAATGQTTDILAIVAVALIGAGLAMVFGAARRRPARRTHA